MADYTLSAKVTGDSSSFNKAMGNASSSASSFSSSMQSVQAKAVAMGQVVGNVVTKIAGKMAQFSSAGVKYNAVIEDYTTSFEVMTGSADKATETVENLKKMGAATPFELTDLAETTKLLMNYGFTADDAQNRLMMLGDISQGSADKMQRIATAYGQMSSAGKVSLEDVKQMIEAGFNPLQEISESTGESMSSLYDRISNGTISVDEITASMQRATSEGGKYFQSMEKQSQTFNGQMSTLQDNVSQIMGSISSDISAMLTGTLLPVANSALGAVVDKFNEGATAGEAFKSGVSTAIDTISEKFPQLGEKIASIKENFAPVAEKATTMAQTVADEIQNSPIFQMVQSYATMAFETVKTSASTTFSGIKADIENGLSPFDVAKNAVGTFADEISQRFPQLGGIITGFSDTFNNIIGFVQPVLETVKTSASTTFSGIKADIENGLSPFDVAKNAVGTFANEITQKFPQLGGIITGFSNTFNNIIGFVQPVFETVKGIVTQFIGSLTSSFNEAGGSTSELSNMFSTIISFSNPLMGIIKNFGPQIGQLVKQLSGPLTNAFSTLGSTISSMLPKLIPIIESLMSAVSSTISAVIPLIAQLVETLLPMAMDIIVSLMPVVSTLLTTIAELIPQILPVITTLVTTLLPVIFSLIQQLAPVISQIVSIVAELFVSLMPIVSQLISNLMPLITTIITVIAHAVEAVLPILITIIGTIISVIEKIMPVITTIVSLVATNISTLIKIITPIISFIGGLIAKIMELVAPIVDYISNVVTDILDNKILPIADFVLAVAENILANVSNKIDAIKQFITNAVETVKCVVETIKSTFKTVFNTVHTTVKNVLDKVKTVFTNVFNKIKGAWTGLTGFVSTIFDNIKSAVDTVTSGIKGAINFVINGINGFLDIINAIPGVQIEHIQQLRSGTDNWQGGFAYMNEGGRGELVTLPDGSQVIPHDISVAYAKQSAKANAEATMIIDYDYLINGIANAMCNVIVTHNTNLDGRTIASTTTPLVDRNLGNRADLEKRFGIP